LWVCGLDLIDIIQSEDGFSILLGSAAGAGNTRLLEENKIRYILNVSDRVRFRRIADKDSEIKIHFVPISDFGDTELGEVLEECFAIIDEARNSKQNILVHCQGGVNRSPTVVIAYLMIRLNRTLKESYQTVKESRSQISPHELYMKQLLECEQRLFGMNTINYEDYCKNSLQAQLRDIRERFNEKENVGSQQSAMRVEERVPLDVKLIEDDIKV